MKIQIVNTQPNSSRYHGNAKKSTINRIKYPYINHFVIFPSLILDFTFSESISSPSCKTQSDFVYPLQRIIIHRIVKKNENIAKNPNIRFKLFCIIIRISDHQVPALINQKIIEIINHVIQIIGMENAKIHHQIILVLFSFFNFISFSKLLDFSFSIKHSLQNTHFLAHAFISLPQCEQTFTSFFFDESIFILVGMNMEEFI